MIPLYLAIIIATIGAAAVGAAVYIFFLNMHWITGVRTFSYSAESSKARSMRKYMEKTKAGMRD